MKQFFIFLTMGLCFLGFGLTAQTVSPPGGGGGVPAGAASGDLGGTYPSPSVVGVGGKAISLAAAFATTGANSLVLNTTGTTNVTLPTTGTLSATFSATTGSIGGGVLLAGACTSGTVAVTNSTTTMTVSVSPNTYPGDGVVWYGYVSSNGTVTVKACAIVGLTPSAGTYNVRVIQ